MILHATGVASRLVKGMAAILLAALFVATGCAPAGFAAGWLWGPHLCRVTPRSAIITFGMTDDNAAQVEYWPAGQPDLAVPVDPSLYSGGIGGTRVIIGNLIPDSPYTYRVIRTGWYSGEYTFRTAPEDPARPFTFVVCGDTQGFSGYSRVLPGISRENAAFWLHPGDMVGSWSMSRWVQFLSISRGVLARTPFYPALGNHDSDDGTIQCLFDVPRRPWYSFDYGPLHVIALDTCKNYDPGSEQYRWLIGDLIASRGRPWKIAFFHHPPYSPTKEDNTLAVRDFLSPLFEQYGVALVFSGHSHVYDRYFVNGVHYVVTGGGGGWLYTLETSSYDAPYHYVRVSVSANQLNVECVKPDGVIVDHFSVAR